MSKFSDIFKLMSNTLGLLKLKRSYIASFYVPLISPIDIVYAI